MSRAVASTPFAAPSRPRASAPECTEVTDGAAFHALADAWNASASAAVAPSVFLRHEWFEAAYAWRSASARLALMLHRNDGATMSVLPLVQPIDRPRSLELLTVPDTQFADMVAPSASTAVAAHAFAAALRARRDWDVLHLNYLRDDSATIRHLVPALEDTGLATHVAARGDNPFVDIGRPWADYFATRSRRLKKALKLAANRLGKAGEIRIEHVTAACDEATFQRALETTIAISAASWKQRTGNALDQPGPQAFIRSLSEAARREGWLSIWLLHLDGRPLAMEYQLACGDAIHALRADYIAECEEISPGTHLFRHLLEQLCDKGHVRYYLGPGDNPYKARWTQCGAPMLQATIYNHTLGGRTQRVLEEFAKPALRRMRDRWSGGRRDAPSPAGENVDAAAESAPSAAQDRHRPPVRKHS